MVEIKVKNQSNPKRCEICHQSDLFDPENNLCGRCLKFESKNRNLNLVKYTTKYFWKRQNILNVEDGKIIEELKSTIDKHSEEIIKSWRNKKILLMMLTMILSIGFTWPLSEIFQSWILGNLYWLIVVVIIINICNRLLFKCPKCKQYISIIKEIDPFNCKKCGVRLREF